MLHDSPNQTRIVAKIIRELLSERRWESLAELTPELSERCRRLKLRIDADVVNAAYTLIASNTSLVQESQRARQSEESPADGRPLTRSEAAGLYSELMARFGPKPKPAAQVGQIEAPADFPSLVEVR